jgi:hypothetical protein
MDGRLIFLHHFRRSMVSGRFVKREPALLEGRPERGRTFTIPKSLDAEPRKAEAGQVKCPY